MDLTFGAIHDSAVVEATARTSRDVLERLRRCIDASIAQMKQDTPALAGFDNAQPALVEMSRASCIRQLGINPQNK